MSIPHPWKPLPIQTSGPFFCACNHKSPCNHLHPSAHFYKYKMECKWVKWDTGPSCYVLEITIEAVDCIFCGYTWSHLCVFSIGNCCSALLKRWNTKMLFQESSDLQWIVCEWRWTAGFMKRKILSRMNPKDKYSFFCVNFISKP